MVADADGDDNSLLQMYLVSIYIYIYIYRVAQKKVPNIRMALCNRVVEMNQQKARM